MPIQPQINSANVTPAQSTKDINQKTNTKQVVSDSGFRPKTDVSIRSAITSLSKVLAEITGSQNSTLEDMPPELQKLIQNILKNSFSLEKTLNDGMGGTIQSQRYVVDQLATLGKFLTQLGELAENQNFTGLPTDLKLILNQFRSLLSQDTQMGTVDLLKTAFNLLNGKDIAALPSDLQLLLTNSPANTAGTASNQQNLLTLKNLLDNLFTANLAADDSLPNNTNSKTDNAAAPTNTNPENNTAAQINTKNTAASNETINTSADAAANKNSSTTAATPSDITESPNLTASKTNSNNTAAAQTDIKNSNELIKTTSNPAGTSEIISETNKNSAVDQLADKTNTTAAQTIAKDAAASSSNNLTAKTITTEADTLNNTATAKTSPAADTSNPAKENINTAKTASSADNALASKTLNTAAAKMSINIENTIQSMQVLKDLGGLIQKNTTLTAADINILKNFINNNEMSAENFQQLQKTLQVINSNIPGVILQAADKQQMPNLAKLWAFIQLSDISTLDTLNAESLKQNGKNIEDFAKIMQRSFGHESSSSAGQKSLDFILPLFWDDQTTYPTYLNIYNEDHKNPRTGEDEYETWFRVCCLTENAGAVEIVLRLYNKHDLNIRLAFSQEDTALSFEDYLPSLRSYLHNAKLSLTELKIDAID